MPELKVIAPWRSWSFRSRTDLINYAAEHQIPVTATAAKPYSMDANLMHISYEGGVLEDPWAAPPEGMFQMTTDPELAPAEAQLITIDFAAGVPVAVDGKPLGAVALLTALNTAAGAHGIGRVDLVENRFIGMKSRGVYETPGVTVLHTAMRALESITLDREVLALRNELSLKVARLIYNGFWYSPEFTVLKRAVTDMTAGVTGTVRLKLYKGQCTVLGRKAPRSLYRPALATFEEDSVYDQADAEGFIRLNGLRLKTYYSQPEAAAPQDQQAAAQVQGGSTHALYR